MLDRRVASLEADMKDVKATLNRIEQQLSGISGELKHMPKGSDYASLKGDVARIDGRLATLPTTWTILTITFTTWAIGSGILIFALNVLRR